MSKLHVDAVHYMGFNSYGVHPVSTIKPGVTDFYKKDSRSLIFDYENRKVPYFSNNLRYDTIYQTDFINKLKREDYKTGADQSLKKELGKYEYSYDKNLVNMTQDKKYKDEDYVREKFAETQKSEARVKAFSNWNSNYDITNAQCEEEKKRTNFRSASIDPLFRPHYHRYHVGSYKTEKNDYLGYAGDIPFEKFFLTNQPKLHSSNYELSKGTSKSTSFIPGYGGFIPTNDFTINNDLIKDPYFACNKTNHLLNYKIKLPGYRGYIPQNPQNIQGNPRPLCLSTRGEEI